MTLKKCTKCKKNITKKAPELECSRCDNILHADPTYIAKLVRDFTREVKKAVREEMKNLEKSLEFLSPQILNMEQSIKSQDTKIKNLEDETKTYQIKYKS
ncbi:unnamed protein product [Euphydryas editha]|uniref:Uncharacterized protein n=1 Tax=Euphydryas editha TaxID=104508 RepID=A0AAU9UNI8_EUPED|nr:unnamed protein product [Euphydryas editha]